MKSQAPSWGMDCEHAGRVLTFLTQIGLRVHLSPGARGFTDRIAIIDGELHVDPMCRASAMLHEAGHLALIPARYRNLLSGDLGAGMKQIMGELDAAGLEPDDPVLRAFIQSGDTEVTAWAWAAGLHLGLPKELIIMDDEYGGEGETLRLQLGARAYLGIHGIAHAGFCAVRANKYSSLPAYPDLAFWLQP